ncbi:MAG: helicase-associated domain-containing protein [Caldilineaceae bacterium]
MTKYARRFDDHLANLRSDDLKSMARLWGGKSPLRKDQALEVIRQGLADPDQVRKAVAGLESYERAALALVKQAGGAINYKALGTAVLAMGLRIPPRLQRGYSNLESDVVRALVQRGLLLSSYSHNPTYLSDYGGDGAIVFSDDRLLAVVGEVEYVPLALPASAPPVTSTYRQPPTVALTIMALLQAVDKVGELRLTQQGSIRVNDLRKVQRALQWPAEDLAVDGLHFADAVKGMVGALCASDWIAQQEDTLVLQTSVDQIATQAYPALATTLLNGFLRLAEWREPIGQPYLDNYSHYHQQGRLILISALKSLPVAIPGFFTFVDFSRAIFLRVGEYFSLNYPPHKPYVYGKTKAEEKKIEEEWRAKLWADWQIEEQIWLERTLTGWLYFLGLIEVGWTEQQPVSFRLTALGKQVFHPTAASTAADQQPEKVATAGATWVVQPNFDIVVYLDRTNPSQLAFLERHAERSQAQQYTAHYRLTRESIYQGLESGSTLDAVLTTLQAGAHAELPRNVVTELREWAALRERITLYRRGHLLEFSDAAARQTALDGRLTGTPVGDRFLLLQPESTPATVKRQLSRHHRKLGESIDYAAPLPRCLTTTETGTLTLLSENADLLIASQLDQWATRQDAHTWQLTAQQVGALGRSRSKELFHFLAARLQHPLPSLLEVALNNWLGTEVTVEVADVTILRCPDAKVMAALKNSKLLKPYWRGVLAPDLLVVETAKVAALQEDLSWAGLTVKDSLVLRKK